MDKIIDQIVALLAANMQTARGIQQIYTSDSKIIPENSFPCIILDGQSTSIESVDTANDQRVCTIELSLVLDARQYFNSSTSNLTEAKSKLIDIMEETATTGMKPKSDTVVGVLRERLDDDATYVLKLDISPVQYFDFSTQPARNFPTVEAKVTIIATSILYLRN